MMKLYLMIGLMLLGLSACEKTNQAFDSAKHFAGKFISLAAPKASEIALTLPSVSPNELNLTAQHYARAPAEQPLPVQTVYFDTNGKAASEPSMGGFYREIFGKTADGRWLVQDFFQDTKLPQTAVLILKNDADVNQFDTSMLDGRNIWFNASGSLHAVADYANGVRQGAQAFYQNKQLVGAVMDKKMLVFHENGKILAVLEHDEEDASVLKTTLFRQDGSALVQSRMRDEQVLSAAAWQPDGKQIRQAADLEAAKQESLPLGQRADAILRLMNE